jgi:hypothetical protein
MQELLAQLVRVSNATSFDHGRSGKDPEKNKRGTDSKYGQNNLALMKLLLDSIVTHAILV